MPAYLSVVAPSSYVPLAVLEHLIAPLMNKGLSLLHVCAFKRLILPFFASFLGSRIALGTVVNLGVVVGLVVTTFTTTGPPSPRP